MRAGVALSTPPHPSPLPLRGRGDRAPLILPSPPPGARGSTPSPPLRERAGVRVSTRGQASPKRWKQRLERGALSALEAEGGERGACPLAVERGYRRVGEPARQAGAALVVGRRVLQHVLHGEIEAHQLADQERRPA